MVVMTSRLISHAVAQLQPIYINLGVAKMPKVYRNNELSSYLSPANVIFLLHLKMEEWA